MTKNAALETAALAPLVSMRRLEQLLGRDRKDIRRIASSAGRYYQPFDQRKVGQTKWRHIDNPTDDLKELQRRIDRNILRTVPLPETMLGAAPGRSIVENASRHVGQPLVITLDLRRCFPSIGDFAVFRALSDQLHCSEEIAGLLTQLTTFHRRLPQGSPASSTLANLVLRPLHDEIQALAQARGFRCTFWVDDITLSGLEALSSLDQVIAMIHRAGHSVSRRKVRRMPAMRRQVVTGTIVNRKASKAREYRQGVRAAILRAVNAGVITDRHLQRLKGQICHVTFVCPQQGRPLESLAARLLKDITVVRGKKERKFEYRPCLGRHRDY